MTDEITTAEDMLTPSDVEEEINGLHYAAAMGDKKGLTQLLETTDASQLDVYGRTALVYAVVSNKMSIAELLVKRGIEINYPDAEGRTALHWACFHNKPRMAKFLIANNADPFVVDYESRTCLHYACTSKSFKCFMLIHRAQGENSMIKRIDQWGMTCLHWACQAGAADIVKFLLTKTDIPFLIEDNEGKLPLHWACGSGDHATLQCILSLLKQKKLITEGSVTIPPSVVNAQDDEGRAPLHICVGTGKPKCVAAMVAFPTISFDIQDNEGRTPLHWAAHGGSKEVISLLYKGGSAKHFDTFDNSGVSALHYAVHEGNDDVALAILSGDGVRDTPDGMGRTAFMVAAIMGRTKMATRMHATEKVDIFARDSQGNSALHMACYYGHSDFAAFLIDKGCPAEDVDDQGVPALFHATEAGHLDCVRILVESGANPNFRDSDDRTLLHWAAVSGHAAVLDYLLTNTMLSPEATDRDLRTPLHNAVFVGSIETAKVLLDHGCDVNAQDNMGVAALHWAVSKGDIDVVKLLVESDADINVTEFHEDRYTPLDYAALSENEELVMYLREVGAQRIDELKTEAAQHLQNWWKGHKARISLLSLLKRHLEHKKTAVKKEKGKGKVLKGRRPKDSDAKNGFDFHPSDRPQDSIADVRMPAKKNVMNRNRSMALPAIANNNTSSSNSSSSSSGHQGHGAKNHGRKKASNNVVSLPSIHERGSPSSPKSTRNKASPRTAPRRKAAARDVETYHGSTSLLPTVQGEQRVVQGERNRVYMIRRKIDAARTIQRAFRRWKAVLKDRKPPLNARNGGISPHKMNRHSKRTGKYEGEINLHINKDDKTQQVAALTIQLHWRQFLQRKAAKVALAMSVMKKRQMQQKAVYTSEVPVVQWKPTFSPIVRPIDFRAIPSPASTSFNMALSTYTKPFADVQKQRFSNAQLVLKQRHKMASKRLRDTESKVRSLLALHSRPRTAAMYPGDQQQNYDYDGQDMGEDAQAFQNYYGTYDPLPEEEPVNFYAQYDFNDETADADGSFAHDGGPTREYGNPDEEDFSRFKAGLQQAPPKRLQVDPYEIVRRYKENAAQRTHQHQHENEHADGSWNDSEEHDTNGHAQHGRLDGAPRLHELSALPRLKI